MSSNAILHLYINHKMNKLVGSNNITTYRQGRITKLTTYLIKQSLVSSKKLDYINRKNNAY